MKEKKRERNYSLTINLEDNVRDKLKKKLSKIPTGPYARLDDFLLEAQIILLTTLPRDTVIMPILNFVRYFESASVIRLRNLPLEDDLPATPRDGKGIKFKKIFLSEAITLGCSQLLGEPASFLTEKDGEIIHNVIPMEQGSYSQSNQGSKAFLNFHNEFLYNETKSYGPYNPDFLTLHCLRSDQNQEAETYFIDARKIVECLSEKTVQTLRRNHYLMSSPSSFTHESNDGKKSWSVPCPILSGPLYAPEISLSANGVKALSVDAQKALHDLREVCGNSTNYEAAKLSPGDMILINNRKALHARSTFTPNFSEQERWLQRVYIKNDLWQLRDRQIDSKRLFH